MAKCILTSIFVSCVLGFNPPSDACAQGASEPADQAAFVFVEDVTAAEPLSPTPITEDETQVDASQPASCCDSGCCCNDQCDGCCGRDRCRCLLGCGLCRCLHHLYRCLNSTCDMFPHYAYFPPMHGYYYFRPYHHSHLAQQQTSVTGWGGDPRNPYANEIFQRVYAEYQAEKGEAPPTPVPAAPQ
jgi:hypothetical protein